jgi:hypothetical protein
MEPQSPMLNADALTAIAKEVHGSNVLGDVVAKYGEEAIVRALRSKWYQENHPDEAIAILEMVDFLYGLPPTVH